MWEMVENNFFGGYDDVTPEVTFNQLVHNLGAPVLRALFDDALQEANRGARGITIEDEDKAWQLDVDADHQVTFQYLGLGPFTLPFEYADSIVERAIAAKEDYTVADTVMHESEPEHISQALVDWLLSLDTKLSKEITQVEESDPGSIGKPEAHAKRLGEAARIAGQRALLHKIIKEAPRVLKEQQNKAHDID